jgi:3-dehydroquinate dehydratase I
MICTAISEKDFIKCRQMVSIYGMVEIRIDLCALDTAKVHEIFASHKNLVATCRPDHCSDTERAELLKTAIKSGARYVDVEIESDKAFIDEMKRVAADNKCDLIISYHNFDATPSQKELETIVAECFLLGADVAKIACMVNNHNDNAAILSLFQMKKRLVALGMGEKGKITRVVSPLLGAEFTFASPDQGEGTAPGQITTERMKSIFTELRRNGIQF